MFFVCSDLEKLVTIIPEQGLRQVDVSGFILFTHPNCFEVQGGS